MSDIETRLAKLESLVESQQEQIKAQQETIEAQCERLDAFEDDSGISLPISRRGALQAGGALGLLGLGAGTASASGSGQIGTTDTPVGTVYVDRLNLDRNIRSDDVLRLVSKTGENNSDSGNFIVGHQNNSIDASKGAVISGGGVNLGDGSHQIGEDGDFGTISGGSNNTVNGFAATVPGGSENSATGDYSFAVGYRAKATDPGAFVVGDSSVDHIESQNEDEARFQMNVVANAFNLVDETDDADEPAEGRLYVDNGNLMYEYDDEPVTIESDPST